MSTYVRCAAVALALAAGAGAADAQTVITREITTAPVETIVERGPTGTVITRRPLDMTVPRAPVTLPGATTIVEPDDAIPRVRESVGLSSTIDDTIVTRRAAVQPGRTVAVQKQRAARAKAQPLRATTTRRAVSVAATTRSAPAVRSVQAAVPSLTAAQRATIYRMVVDERLEPRTVITERDVVAPAIPAPVFVNPAVREQVVSERVIVPSAPLVTGRIEPVPLPRETVGVAPLVTQRVVTAPASVELVVGSRVPATIPLYAFPETLGLRIPAVRSYRYAIVDDRVFLVDPLTNRVVAEIYE